MIVRDEVQDLLTPTGLMRTYLYVPERLGADRREPGLVLYSEIFQQTPPVRRIAVSLASQGYVVAVPEIYHQHEPPGTVLGYEEAGKNRGNACKLLTPLESWDQDLQVVLNALGSHPHCNGSFGAMGICLGGHLSFRAALNPQIKAAACFYATDLHTGTLGTTQPADTLSRAKEIQGELLMVFGRQDPHVPYEGRVKILDALHQSGILFSWHEFNAVHAFLRDEGDRYDPSAARLGYQLVLDLFQRNL